VPNSKFTPKQHLFDYVRSNFITRREFKKLNFTAFIYAKNNNWLADLPLVGNYASATDNDLIRIAHIFTSRKALRDERPGLYNALVARNLLEQAFKATARLKHLPYTKEEVIAEAKKYKTRLEFLTKAQSMHKAASRDGYLDEACKHMPHVTDWTEKKIRLEALKFSGKMKFKFGNRGAYEAAIRLGIYKDLKYEG